MPASTHHDQTETKSDRLAFTLKGAAAQLSVSEVTVLRLIKAGRLDARRLKPYPRSPIRITRAALEAYLDSLPPARPKQ